MGGLLGYVLPPPPGEGGDGRIRANCYHRQLRLALLRIAEILVGRVTNGSSSPDVLL
jgi:hypothetical protein